MYLHSNPNRGKRRATPLHVGRSARLAVSASPASAKRDGRHGTTGVTVTRVDPSYLRRYGTDAALRAADRGNGAGGAITLVRNARNRRDVRAAAELARELVTS